MPETRVAFFAGLHECIMPLMLRKPTIGFVGAISVVVILSLQAIEHWTVVDAVLVGLRGTGPVGTFIANLLLNRVVPLAIAIAAIYLVFEGRKEHSEPALSGPTSQVENKNENNPKQELNQSGIHIPINITSHALAPSIPASIPAPAPKRKPNIVLLEPRVVFLDFVPDRSGGDFIESREETHLKAVLALFRNNVGIDVQSVGHATVNLRFFAADGKTEIGDGVSGVVWLENNQDQFDLIPGGSTGKVIVLTMKDGKLMVPWKRYTQGSWMGGGLVDEITTLPILPKFVEVNLLNGNHQLVHQGYIDLAMTSDGLKAVSAPHRAYWPNA
jgi:hypothetical protein